MYIHKGGTLRFGGQIFLNRGMQTCSSVALGAVATFAEVRLGPRSIITHIPRFRPPFLELNGIL